MSTVVDTSYWVVEVRDPGDLVAGISRYSKRFRFDGPDAARHAWLCWANAITAGFTATADQVREA